MSFKFKTTEKPAPKSPLFYAYTVRRAKAEGQKDYWIRIGACFEHQNGDGADILLDALPLDGRIVLRAPKDEA